VRRLILIAALIAGTAFGMKLEAGRDAARCERAGGVYDARGFCTEAR